MDMSTVAELKKNPDIPELAPGDTVRVSAKIVEGGKERIQVFQGVVIKVRHGGASASFTVRHVAFGIGVERTFPLYSPMVKKVEIVRHGKVRRSKLYYLRGLSGKEARRKIKRVEKRVEKLGEEAMVVPQAEEPTEVLMAPVEETAATPAPAAEQKPAPTPPAATVEEKKTPAAEPPKDEKPPEKQS